MPRAPKWVFDTLDFFMSKLPHVEVVKVEYLSKTLKLIRIKGDFNDLALPVGAFFDIRVTDTDARRYTISGVDAEQNTLDLIAHIHGSGCGSDYIDALKEGDEMILNKPRTDQKYYEQTAEKTFFFGDETSLALACSFLPVIKNTGQYFHFIFELEEINHDIPRLLGFEDYSVYPKKGLFQNQEWLKESDLFKNIEWDDAYFVLTGNVKSVQTFRKTIKALFNVKTKGHGFWLEGKKGL